MAASALTSPDRSSSAAAPARRRKEPRADRASHPLQLHRKLLPRVFLRLFLHRAFRWRHSSSRPFPFRLSPLGPFRLSPLRTFRLSPLLFSLLLCLLLFSLLAAAGCSSSSGGPPLVCGSALPRLLSATATQPKASAVDFAILFGGQGYWAASPTISNIQGGSSASVSFVAQSPEVWVEVQVPTGTARGSFDVTGMISDGALTCSIQETFSFSVQGGSVSVSP